MKEGLKMLTTRFFDYPMNYPTRGFQSMFDELERMRRDMDRLFGKFDGGFLRPYTTGVLPGVFPLVNLTEDRDNYYIRAELPGLTTADLDISVAGNNLSVSGERKIPAEGDNVRYHRKEREAGRFSRMIRLPGEVNPDQVDASLKDGILTVTVAKSEKAKPKQITVH
jgi:HSP20 family protein